jgi:hypothetical protein
MTTPGPIQAHHPTASCWIQVAVLRKHIWLESNRRHQILAEDSLLLLGRPKNRTLASARITRFGYKLGQKGTTALGQDHDEINDTIRNDRGYAVETS